MIATISLKTSDDKRARLNNAMADIFNLIKKRADTANCPWLKEAVNRKIYIVDYAKKNDNDVPEGCNYGVVTYFDRRERDQIVIDVLKIIDSDVSKVSEANRVLLRRFGDLYFGLKKYNDFKKLHAARVDVLLSITKSAILEHTLAPGSANIVNF
ncbi:MAG TPA: hypothetical protein PKD70_11175 [Saprospiraceae bacterium]|nr:hypothetical protein [Saprospiraceae bacterium]HMP14433.1 hypothetical protein [Saprospiraceae bacterium]